MSPTGRQGLETSPVRRSDLNSSNTERESDFNRTTTRRVVSESHGLMVNLKLDPISWSLFFLAFILRAVRIEEPRDVVFDEVHFSRFVSHYIKRTFFFDTQPPFGKQLYSLVGYLAGYDGKSTIPSIGSPYESNFPVATLRMVSCLTGSALSAVAYQTLLACGFRIRTAILGALFIALDNALITQSRFILMDMPQLLFTALALWLFVLSVKCSPTHSSHYMYLTSAIICASLSMSIKYSGLSTLLLVSIFLWARFWDEIGDWSRTARELYIRGLIYSGMFLLLPIAIYTSVFYVHLGILTNAGPHDQMLSSRFQASLHGGLASIVKGQPLKVAHGSQVTLRHSHGRACWLHSHSHVYPVKYPDKRGSSHQQQVTCYSFKDVFNWWIVKKPEKEELVVNDYTLDPIKNGDIIQLVHGMTGRMLNSHDVAAAMSPHNQEVTCYIDYNISMPAQTHWKLIVLNPHESDNEWHAVISRIRLIHVNTSQAMKFSGKQYPDWGFHQHEIVTDKEHDLEDTVWNVEEHRYGKTEDEKERERDLVGAEFVPLEPTRLSFWQKFTELQWKMLPIKDLMEDHLFSSESPLDWPLLTKGIAYWISPTSNSQIYLIGNVALWYAANAGLMCNIALNLWYLLRRRRKILDIGENEWIRFSHNSFAILVAYLVHYVPYFLVETNYFLYQYLPALYFKCLLLAMTIEHLNLYSPRWANSILSVGLIAAILRFLIGYLPIICGSGSLTAQDVVALRWKETWNLLIHK